MPAVRSAPALRRALLCSLLVALAGTLTAASALAAPIGGKFQPDSPASFL